MGQGFTEYGWQKPFIFLTDVFRRGFINSLKEASRG